MIKWYRDNSGLYISKEFFNENTKKYFTLKNLKKQYNQRLNIWGWQKMPDEIKYYIVWNKYIKVPVGFYWTHQEKFEDKYIYNEVKHPKFLWKLYEDQAEKVWELLKNDVWFMYATTWVGKGVMIPYIASQLNCKTLIIVPWIQLLNEMTERIENLLWVTPKTIWGKAQSKKLDVYEMITVATIDSVVKLNTKEYDCILVDEFDKIIHSEKRQEFIKKLTPKYLYWFTWTIKLNHIDNRLINILFWEKIDFIKKNFIPTIYNVHTTYTSELCYDDMKEFVQLNSEILIDDVRNNLIVDTVYKSVTEWEMKHDLVLTNRLDQIPVLVHKLENKNIKVFVVKWEDSKEDRENTISMFKDCEQAVLIWSAQILSRWFDCPILQSVHLIYPCTFDMLIVQSCGRVMREYPQKTYCNIYSYSDTKHPFLHRQSNNRLKAMKNEYWSNVEIINIMEWTLF